MKSRHQSFILYLLLTLFSINIYAVGSTTTDGASWWNTDYNTTEGTDFWVTFIFNYGNTDKDNADLKLKLVATSRANANVRILYTDGTSETFRIAANKRAIYGINLSKGYVMSEQKIENKGIHITSDVPISIYAVSQNETAGSQDGTAVLPTTALQREYVIPTYGTDGISTEFAIIATRDNTVITDFVIKKTHNRNPALSIDTTIRSLTLNAGDAYLYRSNDANVSLSGTKICSSEPIAVFSGGQHADIPQGTPNRNHIYSQIAPTDYWGNTYVCTNTSHQQVDYLRFTALKDNTTISNSNRFTILQSLETYQDTLITPFGSTKAEVYSTTEAVEAFLYLTDMNLNMVPENNKLSLGSPAMCPITPMEQAMHSVIFSTEVSQVHKVN